MIFEHTYSPHDLKKRCYGCIHFKPNDKSGIYGNCICQTNKIKDRHRCATDKACSFNEGERLNDE